MLSDQELRDLQERTALVVEMSSHPGWTMLADRARLSLFQRQQRLVNGKAEDFQEYKTDCAWMDGVSYILGLPSRIEQELETAMMQVRELGEEQEDEDEAAE